MNKRLLTLVSLILILSFAGSAYASNMGFKKIFIDPNNSSFTYENVDKATDHDLDKSVLQLSKAADLLFKSSDLFGNSNYGRDLTFDDRMAQMNMQFLALAAPEGYFIGSATNENSTVKSVSVINNDFNHILLADLNSDFFDVFYIDMYATSAKVVFRQNANGIAQVGLQVVGANSSSRTITYAYDSVLGTVTTYTYDAAAFNSLTTNILDSDGNRIGSFFDIITE